MPLRGHLAEFGLIEAQGLHKVAGLAAIVVDEMDKRVVAMIGPMPGMVARTAISQCEGPDRALG
jgi:hypothetical protein